jgi:hypothetical protein
VGLNAMWRRDGEYIGFEALIPCSLMSLLSCVRVCGMTLTFKGQYVQSTLKKMIWLSSTRRRTASLQRHYLHFCISKASKVRVPATARYKEPLRVVSVAISTLKTA